MTSVPCHAPCLKKHNLKRLRSESSLSEVHRAVWRDGAHEDMLEKIGDPRNVISREEIKRAAFTRVCTLFPYTKEETRNDRVCAEEAVSCDPLNYQYVGETLKVDPSWKEWIRVRMEVDVDLAYYAVCEDVANFQFLSDAMWPDVCERIITSKRPKYDSWPECLQEEAALAALQNNHSIYLDLPLRIMERLTLVTEAFSVQSSVWGMPMLNEWVSLMSEVPRMWQQIRVLSPYVSFVTKHRCKIRRNRTSVPIFRSMLAKYENLRNAVRSTTSDYEDWFAWLTTLDLKNDNFTI